MDLDSIIRQLKAKKLKVTPQRVAVYEAVCNLRNHPKAENIITHVRKSHPTISVATVYKVLDILAENNLITKVKTDKDTMRYDAFIERHHHLYCNETDRIEDYADKELDELILSYFKKKKIKNFSIQDIRLQITGEFQHQNNEI